MSFKVGDKVWQVGFMGPGAEGDIFTVTGVRADGGTVRTRAEDGTIADGWFPFRFEKVAPVPLPQVWRDKIEATLGRDALVELGVIEPEPEPEPKFKVGDRVVFMHAPTKGTVLKVSAGNPVVAWDDGIFGTYRVDALYKVETVTERKKAIHVQFHIETGADYPGTLESVRRDIAAVVDRWGYEFKPGSEISTHIYDYTTTREVLPDIDA